MSLEDFYVNTPGGPNISAFINGEATQHKNYNCSIHCGGRQFCGAGVPGTPLVPLPLPSFTIQRIATCQ